MQPRTLSAIDVPPISYVHILNFVIERQTFAKERRLTVDRKMHRRCPPCSCNINHARSSSHDSAHSSLFRGQCSSFNFGNVDSIRRVRRETMLFHRRHTFQSNALR